jgi:hypothetical protein
MLLLLGQSAGNALQMLLLLWRVLRKRKALCL